MAKALVLLATARHPVSGRAMRAPLAARAAELGLQIAGAEVEGLYVGSPDDEALADFLGMGLKRLHVIELEERFDTLAAAVDPVRRFDPDLILAGGPDGGSGMLPYRLAAEFSWPIVSDVIGVEPRNGGWSLLRALPRGLRQTAYAPAKLVICAGNRAPEPRLPAIGRAKRGRIQVSSSNAHTPLPQPIEVRALRQIGKRLERPDADIAGPRLGAFLPGHHGVSSTGPVTGLSPDEAAARILGWLAQRGLIGEINGSDSQS